MDIDIPIIFDKTMDSFSIYRDMNNCDLIKKEHNIEETPMIILYFNGRIYKFDISKNSNICNMITGLNIKIKTILQLKNLI